MNHETTGYQLTINLLVVIVLLALFVAGIGYAWLVRKLRQRKPDHGYTAALVVVGDLIVAVGYAALVGLDLGLLLVLCLAAAGLPMVVEYTEFYLRTEETKGGLDL